MCSVPSNVFLFSCCCSLTTLEMGNELLVSPRIFSLKLSSRKFATFSYRLLGMNMTADN